MYYTLIMRNVSSIISLIACVCLLGFQMSGLHTHVDEHGYDGTPKGIHLHDFSNLDDDTPDDQNHLDDHDYTSDKDVFIFDLALGASKVLDFSILAGFNLFVATKSIYNYSSIYLHSQADRHREHRWPQLRAPPHNPRLLSL